jgi:hypothetical protein
MPREPMSTRSLSGRASVLPVLIAALLLLAVVAPAPAAADPAAALYQPNRIDTIGLNLSPSAISALEAEPEEYVVGTFSLSETDGSPETIGPWAVEVRLKGEGSFKTLAGKAAFKLKFPNKLERPFGLKKMTLNNMVEDPSMIHETLAYAAYRAAGVPAPRTSYAYVYVNGVDYGLHLDIETLDDVSLKNLFGDFDDETQHLYEGEAGDEVRPGGASGYEVDEGDKIDLGDLEALIAAVNSDGSEEWSMRVAATADLLEMTRMWAVEKYAGQWDGYTSGGSPFQPNNYYLYSDPSGRFQMLPWGSDETWQERNHLEIDAGNGLLFTNCLDDAACAVTYRESMGAVCGALGGVGLDSLAVNTAAALAPWQAIEQSNGARHVHDLDAIQDGVAETRDFIASRPAEVAAFLGEPCAGVPVPPATTPDVAAEESTQDAESSAAVAGPPVAGLFVGRARVADGRLRTELRLPGPGAVTQRATISTTAGKRIVCEAEAEVKQARDLTLSCHLSAGLRDRLRARWIAIKVTTTFEPATGAPETTTQRLVLPRDPKP